MLTLIAYRFLLGQSLPPVSYLTRLDYFLLGATILVFIALFGGAGFVVDSIQSAAGLVEFAGTVFPVLAPLWIVALWVHFSTALVGPLSPLGDRPLVALVLGALGAPLSYSAGVGLGAATFPAGTFAAMLFQSLAWAALLPTALLWLRSPSSGGPPRGRLEPVLVRVPVLPRKDRE